MPNPNDRDLTGKIRAALARENLLRPYDLKVKVVDTVAHLQGIVDVLTEKTRAGEVARAVAGVTSVDNAITVCTDGAIDDGDVLFEVSEELRADPRLEHLGAEVHNGSVRLMGQVDTLTDEAHAIRVASSARGVREVHSDLRIEGQWPSDDATMSNRVEQAISRSPRLAGEKVAVSVNHGAVTLNGQVPDSHDMEMAVEIASSVEGVQSVRNQLTIEPDSRSKVVTGIVDELKDDPFVREAPLSISVVHGEIRVEGQVKDRDQKRRVERVLQKALKEHRGEVIGIDNRLIIEPD